MSGIVRLFKRTTTPCTTENRGPKSAAPAAGFTLIELLVALAVVSVSVGVIITLFTQSLALGEASRNERVATSLAEAQLLALELTPDAFAWPTKEDLSGGGLVELHLRGEEPTPRGHPFTAPETSLTFQKGTERVRNYYEDFTWEAFLRLPTAEAGYAEVTMVVQWIEGGRAKSLSMTSSLPRSAVVEEAA